MASASAGAHDRLLQRRSLIAACVLGASVEAIALTFVGPADARALSPQLVAIPPLGVFHDLRWLFVYTDSWLTFALGAAALLVIRSLLTAALVRLAWPADLPRPPFRRTAVSAGAFTLVAGALLSPMVTVLFGVAVVPFSWPYLAAVGAAILLALLLCHGGVVGSWWRVLPTGRALLWLITSVLVFTASSIVTMSLPVGLGVLPAALAGLFDAWAWYGVAASLARRPQPRWRLPVAPATAALVLLAIVGAARLGFLVHTTPQSVGAAPPPGSAQGRPVIVVGGFGSACCLKAHEITGAGTGLVGEQFSYAGLDADGRPRPQSAAATDTALPALARHLAAQVNELARRTHRPVAIVAESEGTLVALDYLAVHPRAPVDALVLLSPILDPGRVSFPRPAYQGWGVAAGWELRAVVSAISRISPFRITPDGPLLRSIDNAGALLAAPLACRPGLHTVAFVPLADAVTLPLHSQGHVPEIVVSAFHGGLLGRPDVEQAVRTYLSGGQPPSNHTLSVTADVISDASAAWRVPSLVDARPAPAACATG